MREMSSHRLNSWAEKSCQQMVERNCSSNFQITLQLLDKALSIYEGRCFDQLRLLQQLEEQAEEQQMVLTDGYFQRMVDECYEPGTVFPNVAADCARCCELAGEIACVITGRDRL